MRYQDYAAQVALLVQILPLVAKEDCFALKGGTAINLFYRDLPRLSVDIDLTYLPLEPREPALVNINTAMERLAKSIAQIPNIQTKRILGGGQGATRVQVIKQGVTVKIETTPVTRGVVFEPELKRVSPSVEDQFGFAEMKLVSFEDIYGGKICAALDRQHPRDLYDVTKLYENEGLTDSLFRAFLVYAASSKRPLCELLNPNLSKLKTIYETQFVGMTKEAVHLEELETTRLQLIADIQSRLTGDTAAFLRGLQDGEPNFKLIGLEEAKNLPAVKWKLINIEKFIHASPVRHADQTAKLEGLLLPK